MLPDPGDQQQAEPFQKLLEAAILDQCGATDGIEDGILDDPGNAIDLKR